MPRAWVSYKGPGASTSHPLRRRSHAVAVLNGTVCRGTTVDRQISHIQCIATVTIQWYRRTCLPNINYLFYYSIIAFTNDHWLIDVRLTSLVNIRRTRGCTRQTEMDTKHCCSCCIRSTLPVWRETTSPSTPLAASSTKDCFYNSMSDIYSTKAYLLTKIDILSHEAPLEPPALQLFLC